MNNYHNVRNSKGQFTRQLAVSRAPDGKFATPFKIVAGRLYSYRGATVRALQRDTKANARLISFHKTLFGFVKDNELKKIPASKVEKYLAAA